MVELFFGQDYFFVLFLIFRSALSLSAWYVRTFLFVHLVILFRTKFHFAVIFIFG